MKQAAIYARVSTDEQVNNTSLDGQVELCRRYAEYHEMEVVVVFREDFSGAYLEERPELARLLNLVRNHEIDAVICKSSDRWSRDVSHGKSLFKILNRAGVELHYTNRGQSLNTPNGRFHNTMEGGFDELWREVIIELMMNGKNDKAMKEKRPVMSGHAPYGYRTEGKGSEARYVFYEPEVRTVRDIFEWYIYGDGEGPLSLRAIADKLDRRRDLKPNGKIWKNKKEEILQDPDRLWIPATVRGILANSIYAGVTYYGKTRVVEGQRKKQPFEEWIEIDVPDLAIIDMDTFEAAQVRARRNQELARRNQKREYLLSGFFRCGSCNSAMAGTTSQHNGYIETYYRCGNHWRKPGQSQCPHVNRTVVASKVEGPVWDWLEELLRDDNAIIDGIQAMVERSENELQPMLERLSIVEEMIAKAEKKIRRLMNMVETTDDEDALQTLQDEITRSSKEKAAFEKDRKKLQADLAQRSVSPELEEQLLKIAAELREELQGQPDYETKRYVMNRLNLQTVFHTEGERRWMIASCGLVADPKLIMISPSRRTPSRWMWTPYCSGWYGMPKKLHWK